MSNLITPYTLLCATDCASYTKILYRLLEANYRRPLTLFCQVYSLKNHQLTSPTPKERHFHTKRYKGHNLISKDFFPRKKVTNLNTEKLPSLYFFLFGEDMALVTLWAGTH